MKKGASYYIKIALLLFVIVLILLYIAFSFGVRLRVNLENLKFVELQEGHAIETFADELGPSSVSLPGPNKGVRMLEYRNNAVYATLPGRGEVVALIDYDGDWELDERRVVIDGLKNPHGIAFYENYIYIATEEKVLRLQDKDHDHVADVGSVEELVELPKGNHWTRTVKIFNDEMYISVGSSCNVCEEEDERRAAIMKCNLEGQECEIFARGLRNSVDLEWHNDEIWATENGRDLAGNDFPPDEINIITQGEDYGWPLCFGRRVHDTQYDTNQYIRNPCEDTQGSLIDIPAHSAPIGLAFFEGDLFVAYHGSWNRDPPTGYKIVRINLETRTIEDFATGWLDGNKVHGRPTDILIVGDSMLISDDVAGKVYRIYQK